MRWRYRAWRLTVIGTSKTGTITRKRSSYHSRNNTRSSRWVNRWLLAWLSTRKRRSKRNRLSISTARTVTCKTASSNSTLSSKSSSDKMPNSSRSKETTAKRSSSWPQNWAFLTFGTQRWRPSLKTDSRKLKRKLLAWRRAYKTQSTSCHSRNSKFRT